MSGNKKAILDSNVIIEASKQTIDAQTTFADYQELLISVVSYTEVMGFEFANKDEKAFIEHILQQFPVVDINKTIADIAVEYRKKRKIKLPDAFILATAKHLQADLLTSNVDDFKNIDDSVQVIKPKK